MLRLLLLRHAKSDWSRPGLPDHDRALARRGLRDAPRLGRFLRDAGLVPEVALVSTARRARDTARLALDSAGAPPETVRLLPDLYGSGRDRILRIVREQGGSASPLLVVAHNPGLEDLVSRLAFDYRPFPTAALAVVSVPAPSWPEFGPTGEATVEQVVRPRDLPAEGSPGDRRTDDTF